MDETAELKEYRGSCHCGRFKFSIKIPALTTVWSCNCSICSRNGYLWVFRVPDDKLVIEPGSDDLKTYEFGKKLMSHQFCSECGSSVMGRRSDAPKDQSLRINARMLDNIDVATLEVKTFNGADVGAKYVAPGLPSQLPGKDVGVKTYKGNCHCGNFKFSITVPELKKVRPCDCSICTKTGYMWVFPVSDENMIVETGEGTLRSYEFGEEAMTHFFCPKCGSSVMALRREALPGGSIGINSRVLKDIDLDALEIEMFKGGELKPKYKPPPLPAWEGEVEEGLTIYQGNCHCGAVTYAVKSKPLNKLKVMSCNCSLCSRNGDLWIYPSKSAVQLHGAENLTDYVFLEETSLHSFCSMCGVSAVVKVMVPGEDIMPLNVRTIEGVDLQNLEYKKYDGRSNNPQYSI